MSTRRRFPGSRVSVPDGRDVSLSRRRPRGNFHGGDAHQQPGAPGPRSARPAPPRSSRTVCVCEQGDWSTGHRVPCCAGEAEAGWVRPLAAHARRRVLSCCLCLPSPPPAPATRPWSGSPPCPARPSLASLPASRLPSTYASQCPGSGEGVVPLYQHRVIRAHPTPLLS